MKIRSGAAIKNMAMHLAIGVRTDGTREVLGMWLADNEGAAFWASVFNGLKNRGVEDILIAVTDGLKGMTEALEAVFPQSQHQSCIVHLLRASTAFISHKDRAAVCKGLKPVYQAVDASTAEKALEAFEQSDMGKNIRLLDKPGAAPGRRLYRSFNSLWKFALCCTRPTALRDSIGPSGRLLRRDRCFRPRKRHKSLFIWQ